MGATGPFLESSSDYFVGRRGRLTRYLVCAMEGDFRVVVLHGDDRLTAVLRTGAPHPGPTGTVSITSSGDGARAWSDAVHAQGQLVVAAWRLGDPSAPGSRALWTAVGDPGGATWTDPIEAAPELRHAPSPYGRMLTEADGTMLCAACGAPRPPSPGVGHACVVRRSTDRGRRWGDESLVAARFNEAALAGLRDGRLLSAARSQEPSASISILTSADRGRTWSAPREGPGGGLGRSCGLGVYAA